MELEAHDDSGVHIIWLPEEGENRLTLAFMDNYLRLFRRAEKTASAIITASRSKKFWSNGVDLKANQTLDILRGLSDLALVLLESKTPTIAFLKDKKLIEIRGGMIPKPNLQEMIEDLIAYEFGPEDEEE
jgi:hypothetical protein